MKPIEFEEAVRELRRRQKRFFHCRKDDPDKEKAKTLMREQEQVVFPVVDAVLAQRPAGKRIDNEREEFFMVVADMVRKQRDWMKQGGGSWSMYTAREAEKMCDKWLAKFDEEHREEKRLAAEEERAKQPTLF